MREDFSLFKEDPGGRRCLDEEDCIGSESTEEDSIIVEGVGGEGESDGVVGPVACQHQMWSQVMIVLFLRNL